MVPSFITFIARRGHVWACTFSFCNTMSGSGSDSSSDAEETMIVRLADIRTIGQAFQSGVLKPAAKPRYKPNEACLDRISLL